MKNQKSKKCINTIIGTILNILLTIITIVILIGFYYIYQIKIQNKNYADMFGYTFFEVATGSMEPTIKIGDVVIVKITKEVEPNDIIVYKEENNFITHRLIKKEENKLQTKGDANNSEDKPIQEEQVLGEVIRILPQVGVWKKVIATPEVMGLIVILITLFSIVLMYNSKTEEKNEQ